MGALKLAFVLTVLRVWFQRELNSIVLEQSALVSPTLIIRSIIIIMVSRAPNTHRPYALTISLNVHIFQIQHRQHEEREREAETERQRQTQADTGRDRERQRQRDRETEKRIFYYTRIKI